MGSTGIIDPPPIYVAGSTGIIDSTQVSIVGSTGITDPPPIYVAGSTGIIDSTQVSTARSIQITDPALGSMDMSGIMFVSSLTQVRPMLSFLVSWYLFFS